MVEADDYLGGVPVQHRQVQGHEDGMFHGYFEALEYLDGGIETGFRHVEPSPENPTLFHVKGTMKNMTLTQVPLSKNSLNEGDSFILNAGKDKVWCWHGKKVRIVIIIIMISHQSFLPIH
jgi:gelsolin